MTVKNLEAVQFVYKLLPWAEWEAIRSLSEWRGSAVDLADGFVHFSTREQVEETARKHFADQGDLALLAVATARVTLRWEPSRGGALFPHLYGALPMLAVEEVERVPADVSGHVFPDVIR